MEIIGTPEDDNLVGTSSADVFIPGTGQDSIEGGYGVDEVVLNGPYSQYSLNLNSDNGVVTVTDGFSSYNLIDVEKLTFDDIGVALYSEFRFLNGLSPKSNSPNAHYLPTGGYVVSWNEEGPNVDDDGNLISSSYLQRYDLQGNPIGEVLTITQDGIAQEASVAGLSDGRIIASWHYNGSLEARVFSFSNTVNTVDITLSDQYGDQPQVAALADGGWAVIYAENINSSLLRLLIFDSNNEIVSDDLIEDPDQLGLQDPAITVLADNSILIAYQKNVFNPLADNYSQEVRMRILTSDGNQIGEEISATTDAFITDIPSITPLSDGGWVLTFRQQRSLDGTANTSDVYQQRFSSSGQPIGDSFKVNISGDEVYLSEKSVAALTDGGWVVSWNSVIGQDGNREQTIFQRRFAADGQPVGEVVRVNSLRENSEYGYPIVTPLSDGGWFTQWTMATGYVWTPDGWEEASDDGISEYAVGRRFASDGTNSSFYSLNIFGDDTNQTVSGGDGADFISTAGGDDSVTAGSGDDLVFAGAGNDLVIGGAGAGDDYYDGGEGIDTVLYLSATAGIYVDLTTNSARSKVLSEDSGIGRDQLYSIENVIASQYDDILIGDDKNNVFYPSSGSDDIEGGFGVDTVVFDFLFSEYTFSVDDSSNVVIEGLDGRNILANIEIIKFADVQINYSKDFKVNTATNDDQYNAQVVKLSDGGYVVLWRTWDWESDISYLYLQKYNSDGQKVGDVFNVINDPVGRDFAKLSSLDNGNLIVTWMDKNYQTEQHGIKAKIFDSNLNPISDNLIIAFNNHNEEDDSYHFNPEIISLDGDKWAVIWASSNSDQYYSKYDTSEYIYLSVYDGVNISVEKVTINEGFADVSNYRINKLSSNDILVTYVYENELFASIYSLDLNEITKTYKVFQESFNFSDYDVISTPNGIVITWAEKIYVNDEIYFGVDAYFQVIETYEPVSRADQVITSIDNDDAFIHNPSVKVLADGNLLLSWTEDVSSEQGDLISSYVQKFSLDGGTLSEKLLVYSDDNNDGVALDIAALDDGGWIVAWSENKYFHEYHNTYARRYDANGVSFNSYSLTIIGDQTDQFLTGSINDDYISAMSGNDYIISSSGDDVVFAGDGNDIVVGGNGEGDDEYYGGDGQDTLIYTSATAGIIVNLLDGFVTSSNTENDSGIGYDLIQGFENVIAGNYDDEVVGDDNDNSLSGEDGNDKITGNGGNDTIDGGLGSDTAIYSGLKSRYTITKNQDGSWTVADQNTETGSDGVDTLLNIESLSFSDQVFSLLEKPIINGTSRSDRLTGTDADEQIYGFAGNDRISAGKGDDTVDGGSGNDYLDGGRNGSVGDTVSYGSASSGVMVSLAERGEQNTRGAGKDKLTGFENLTGSDFADRLTGDNKSNVITGGEGDDVIKGGLGVDTLIGGEGQDTFVFSSIKDTGNSEVARDVIIDFQQGLDLIDLRAIDASTSSRGNNSFVWLGLTDTFGTRSVGELRYEHEGGNTVIYGDIDRDTASEFQITLIGVYDLAASDFVL